MDDFAQPRNVVHGSRYKPDREPSYQNYSRSGNDPRKMRSLPRTISAANISLVEQYQSVVARDYVSDAPEGGSTFFANTPMYTLALPVMENREFREYVLDLLRDHSVQRTLEMEHVINWCDSLTTLIPLKTISDGNCLLHSASLAMWGFQDRKLFLRRALNSAVASKTRNTLYDRWVQTREAENQKIGLILEPHEWDEDWQTVKRRTTTDIVVGANVDSLDDFHVFVLANVLRRPIIMYASPKIRSLASGGTIQKLNFSGVYLPLLWDPAVCKRSPLPLGYCSSHFSALTMMESPDQYNRGQLVLPLVENEGFRLPVKFAVKMEDPRTLLHEYLDITEVRATQSLSVPCCKLTIPDANKSNNFTHALAKTFVQAYADNYDMGRGPSREPLSSERHPGNSRQQEVKPFTQSFQRPREEDNSQQARSKTTIQPTRGRGTVKCSECSEPGLPQFLGRCERCHNRIQSNDEGSIYEPIPSPVQKRREGGEGGGGAAPALPIPRNQSQRSQCRTPGCDFFGTKEFRFYCSKCFDANMDTILKEVDEGPPVAPAPASSAPGFAKEPEDLGSRKGSSGSKDPAKCHACREFFGSTELNGLCNKCFLKSTEKKGGKPPIDPFQQKVFHDHQDRDRKESKEKFVEEPKYNRREVDSVDYSIPAPMKKKQSSNGDLNQMNSQMGKVNLQAESCVICQGTNIANADSEAFVLCRQHAMKLMGGQGSTGGGEQRREDDPNRRRSAIVQPWNDAGDGYSAGRDKFSYTQPVSKTGRSGYDNEFSSDDQYRQIQKRDGGGYDSPGSRPRMNTDYSSHVQHNNARQGYDDPRDFHHQRGVDHAPGSSSGGERGYHTGGIDGRGHNLRGEREYQADTGGFNGGRRDQWEDPQQRDAGERGGRFDTRNSDWKGDRPGDGRMSMGNMTAGYRLGGEDRNPRMGLDDRVRGFGGDDRGSRVGNDRGLRHGGADGRGGSEGWRTAGAGGMDLPSNDKLCVEPGCSFYAHKELENRCPSCYELVFKKAVDRDIFPEV